MRPRWQTGRGVRLAGGRIACGRARFACPVADQGQDLLRSKPRTETPEKGNTVELLTLAETALRLKVSLKTVKREVAAGNLPSIRIRSAIRIDPGDVDIYLADRRKQKPPEQARGAGPKPRKVKGGFQYMGA